MSARDEMTDDEALAEYAHALISGEPYAGWPLTDEEADDETDASNAVGALFPRREDPLADLREPERRASHRRQKPYGTVDPDHELHRNVRDIFLGRP